MTMSYRRARPGPGSSARGRFFASSTVEGQQAVDTLFYAADDFAERYCAQSTPAAQGSAYIGTGTQILSNRGRLMADHARRQRAAARHLGGRVQLREQHGPLRPSTRTTCTPAATTSSLELAKHGMSKRDIVSNINFFMNVPVMPNGELTFVDGVSKPGDYVELRAEMDVLCVISNCPQLNNPCNGYNPTPDPGPDLGRLGDPCSARS